MHSFKELKVWQKSRILIKEMYLLIEKFMKNELYGATSHIKRSSFLIASNIAESCGRNSDKDLCRFLNMANGSAFKLESDLILCNDIGLTTKEEFKSIEEKVKEVQSMINRF